jgi:hypothetical protein
MSGVGEEKQVFCLRGETYLLSEEEGETRLPFVGGENCFPYEGDRNISSISGWRNLLSIQEIFVHG